MQGRRRAIVAPGIVPVTPARRSAAWSWVALLPPVQGSGSEPVPNILWGDQFRRILSGGGFAAFYACPPLPRRGRERVKEKGSAGRQPRRNIWLFGYVIIRVSE